MITNKQHGAITKSVRLGLQIQKDYPQVAGSHISGNSLTEITKNFCFQIIYGTDFKIAREAVRKALSGYNGNLRDFPERYSGLINQDELKKLEKIHKLDGAKKALENRLGICGLTIEERKIYSREAVIAQGKTPWIERKETENFSNLSEIEFAYMLSQSSEFLLMRGTNKGKVNLEKIASLLNQFYHYDRKIRTADNLSVKLVRFRKMKNG